jgi:hypothetical protein
MDSSSLELASVQEMLGRMVVELASAVRQGFIHLPLAKMIFTDYELRIIIVVRNA